MIKYYYSLDGQQLGPVTIEELKTIGITKDTLVWTNGMDAWKAAKLVEDLDVLFEATPPPIQQAESIEVAPIVEPTPEETKVEQFEIPKENHESAKAETASSTKLEQPPFPKPSNWLVPSILVTLFCCMPFGIVSIIYGSKVDKLYFLGDYMGAAKSANTAKKWVIAAIVAGILSAIIYILITVAAIGVELDSDQFDYGGYYM